MTSDDSSTAKTIKNNFEFELLLNIERLGGNRKLICKEMNVSNSNLQYHLNRLKPLVQKIRMGRFSILQLTDMGKTIKENLGGSHAVELWRCHNLIVGFKISDMGSFKFNPSKTVQMRNWFYQEEKVRDSFGEWKVHIQSTGLLKVYCPSIYHQSDKEAFGNMEDVSCRIAQTFRESYSMGIGLMFRIRDGHKERVGSEILGRLMKGKKVNKVWADSSTGTLRLEESQSSNQIEDLLEMPSRIDALEKHLIEQTKIMDEFSRNLKLHLEVLTEMKDALRRLGK